jgi:co-chaperonin GroES (HSP10)
VPDFPRKQLIVVGDRVLVAVEEGEERSKVGLYLPPSALDSQAVQGGRIVATGPGTPMPSVADYPDEPWRIGAGVDSSRFVPMQAREGDYALFFRKAGVEITFEHEKYLVVPQSAILALVREPLAADPEELDRY